MFVVLFLLLKSVVSCIKEISATALQWIQKKIYLIVSLVFYIAYKNNIFYKDLETMVYQYRRYKLWQ